MSYDASAGREDHQPLLAVRSGGSLSCRRRPCQDALPLADVRCTSAIRALLAFSGGHHSAHNFLVKWTCCHFAQVIGVTSDPRITFPSFLKIRTSTLGLCTVPAGSRPAMASLA